MDLEYTVSVNYKGKTIKKYSKTLTYNVIEEKMPSINCEFVELLSSTDSGYSSRAAVEKNCLEPTHIYNLYTAIVNPSEESGYNLTVTSSNPSVAEVFAAQDVKYPNDSRAPQWQINVKKAGNATITFTSNGTKPVKRVINIVGEEAKVIVDKPIVTIDKAKEDMLVDVNYEIRDDLELVKSEVNNLPKDLADGLLYTQGNTNSVFLRLSRSATRNDLKKLKKSYTIPVTVYVRKYGEADDQLIAKTVNIKLEIKETVPSAKIKTIGKINTFYLPTDKDNGNRMKSVSRSVSARLGIDIKNSSNVSLKINSGKSSATYTLGSASILEQGHMDATYNVANYAGKKYSELDKTMEVKIIYTGFRSGYETIQKVKVPTEHKAPKISIALNNPVFYEEHNAWSSTLKVNCDCPYSDAYTMIKCSDNYSMPQQSNGYFVNTNHKNGKLEVTFHSDSWASDVKASTTAKIVKKGTPTIKAEKTTLTMNSRYANYDCAESMLQLVNSLPDYAISAVEIAAADKKTKDIGNKLQVTYDSSSKSIVVKFGGDVSSSTIKNGTYTYTLTPIINNSSASNAITCKTIKIKVNVVNKEAGVKVTVNKNKDTNFNSINVLDRRSTAISYDLVPYNINGDIKTIEFAGRDKDMFRFGYSVSATKVELPHQESFYGTEECRVYLKEGYKVSTASKYQIQFAVKIVSKSNQIDFVSSNQIIKLTQKNPTVAFTNSMIYINPTIQNGDNGSVGVKITGNNPNGTILIEKVKGNNTYPFYSTDLYGTNAYYPEDPFGLLNYGIRQSGLLVSIEDMSMVKIGKVYSIPVDVYFTDSAVNEKPVHLTLKVKVDYNQFNSNY